MYFQRMPFETECTTSYFNEIKHYVHTQWESLALLNFKQTAACNRSVQKHNYLLLVF